MKRLRDEFAGDPTRARGKRLLHSGSAGPRRSVSEMKRRVWRSLVENRAASASARTARHSAVRRRSALVTLLLVLSTATAGAVIGRHVISRRSVTPAVSDHRAAVEARPARHQSAGRRSEAVDDLGLPQEDRPSSDIAVPTETPRRVGVHPHHGADRSTPAIPERTVARSVVDEKEQAEHQLVVDAMLALRRARDFRRAGLLLESYLAKNPQGTLREEAIALAVEAAAARADLARRDHWASVYLKDYPAGRFRRYVEASRADGK